MSPKINNATIIIPGIINNLFAEAVFGLDIGSLLIILGTLILERVVPKSILSKPSIS